MLSENKYFINKTGAKEIWKVFIIIIRRRYGNMADHKDAFILL